MIVIVGKERGRWREGERERERGGERETERGGRERERERISGNENWTDGEDRVRQIRRGHFLGLRKRHEVINKFEGNNKYRGKKGVK